MHHMQRGIHESKQFDATQYENAFGKKCHQFAQQLNTTNETTLYKKIQLIRFDLK